MRRIEVVDVKKQFNNGHVKTDVLKGISIAFPDNKITTITGPSGSGKSTLLYLLGALDIPTSGDVIINGKSTKGMKPSELSEIRRSYMGFVFQFYNLLAGLTVRENIVVPLILDHKSIARNKEYVDELLELVGLTHRVNYPINQLSGGEQQRVAIARALVNKPDIIIADEPTGNLDSERAQEVLNILKKLSGKEKTIIIVTHDEEVNQCGDHQIRIKDGLVYQNQENAVK